jgi:hypothetical protein
MRKCLIMKRVTSGVWHAFHVSCFKVVLLLLFFTHFAFVTADKMKQPIEHKQASVLRPTTSVFAACAHHLQPALRRLHHAPPQPLPAQTSAATPSSARTRTSCRLRSFSAGWMASARKHKRSAVVNSVVAKVTCAMSSTLTPAASQARCNCWW